MLGTSHSDSAASQRLEVGQGAVLARYWRLALQSEGKSKMTLAT